MTPLDIQDVVADGNGDATKKLQRRSDEAYIAIRDCLLRGVYLQGQRLVIRDLASQLSMSMTPVREALLRLASEGALEASQHRSVQVPKLTFPQIREVWLIRRHLESFAAVSASRFMTRTDYATLESLQVDIAEARQKQLISDLTEKTRLFYFSIFEKGDMPRLTQIIEGLWLQAMPVITWRLSRERASKTPDKLRKALVQAFKRDDRENIRNYIHKDIDDALARIKRLVDKGISEADH